MKLVHVISSLKVGGAEVFLLRLLQNLPPHYQSEVIALSSDGPIGNELRKLGIPVTVLGMRAGRFNPFKVLRLARILRHLKPDVVQTWMYHSDLLGGLTARLVGVPVVLWSIHHTNLDPGSNKRLTLLVARVCALLSRAIPDRILCVAEASRAVHVRFGYAPEKITVIPNGFDLSDFQSNPETRSQVRAELGLGDDTPLVGFVARFDVQKSHKTFLDVAVRVRDKVPGVRFLLAGDGIDASNKVLAGWMADRGLQDCMILLGYRSDVSRLMTSFDVLALSSIGEGFPNVVGEAMACGVPCVVTDVGDTALIVGDTGFVRPVGDVEGVALDMITLLLMPKDQRAALGERARQRIVENFGLDGIVRRYQEQYDILSRDARR